MTESDVRKLLRLHHAGFTPDDQFASRVLARLPRIEGWSIGWAAARVLPVSIALAMVLMIATVATGRWTGRTVAGGSASASVASQGGNDPLEWLLEGREDRR